MSLRCWLGRHNFPAEPYLTRNVTPSAVLRVWMCYRCTIRRAEVTK